MKYRIFKSPGAFNGAETCKAELVATEFGPDAQTAAGSLVQAVKASLEKLARAGEAVAVSPPVDDGYSRETGTRFLSMRAMVEAAGEKPRIFHYDVIETAD